MSNAARAQHYRNLEQQVASMIAQIETGTASNDNREGTASTGRRATAKVERLQCTFPGCSIAASGKIFIFKSQYESHLLEHYPKTYTCLACGATFENEDLCQKHHEKTHEGLEMNIEVVSAEPK